MAVVRFPYEISCLLAFGPCSNHGCFPKVGVWALVPGGEGEEVMQRRACESKFGRKGRGSLVGSKLMLRRGESLL